MSTPSSPELRHGIGCEDNMAAANKQPSAGGRPGPLPVHTHGAVKGGVAKSDSSAGKGNVAKGQHVKPTGGNPRKMH